MMRYLPCGLLATLLGCSALAAGYGAFTQEWVKNPPPINPFTPWYLDPGVWAWALGGTAIAGAAKGAHVVHKRRKKKAQATPPK